MTTFSFPSVFLGRRHSRLSRRGFGLAECILSVAITATSLLAVVGMLSGTLSAARQSREETIAGVMLRQLVGEMKDLPQSPKPGVKPQPVVVLMDEALQILEHSRYPGGAGILETYKSGSSNPAASAFAWIERIPDPQDTMMDRVIIRIESPAAAPATARTIRQYAALSPK